MFNAKNLRKISLIYGAITLIIFMFGFFDIQWRGASLINNMPNIEIQALAPIKTILVNLVGQDYGQLINNIVCLNLVWYIIVVFPVWCWNFVRRAIHLDEM